MYYYERSEAVIDLDALLYNITLLKNNLPDSVKTVAVIKADAYGHGALRAAGVLEPLDFIFGFAVATVEEGISLREAGVKKPIMLLGYAFPSQYEEAVINDLWLAVFRKETAEEIASCAENLSKTANIQIAVDTGMNRIGYRVTEENADRIAEIAAMAHINVQGMFTHFYASDEADKSRARVQYKRFLTMKGFLDERGVKIPYLHCSNSAAIIDLPEYHMDLVRAGIAMYGLAPSSEVQRIGLKPVMSVKARVVHVKTVPAGESISYGGIYTTPKKSIIATIGFGYADGYPRQLSNKASVLIRGQRAPVRGRICMDQFMVDVTGIKGVSVGDEAVLIGTDGEECITMEELGDISGRFNYETACCISKRVPRVYLHGSEIML